VAGELPRARLNLPSWWWDLPLRWKGFITVALPTLALVLSIIGAVVLNAQRDDLRQEVLADREVQDLSLGLQQELSDVERAVLRYAATGDSAFVAEWPDLRSNFSRDADALLERADGDVNPLAEDAVQSAHTAVDELDQLRGAVAGGGLDADELSAAVLAARDRSRTVAAQFDAVDAQLAADVASGGERIDDRGMQIVVVLIGGVLVAAVAVWITMWLFTRSIVQRIHTIAEVAGGVIAGDKSIDIEEPANDEIGTLAQQLRQAAEVLILNNLELERTRDAERERLEQEQVIRDVVRRIHEAVGQDEVLAATVRELGPATDSDRVLVVSVEHGGMGTVLAEWVADGLPALGVGWRLPADEQRDINFGLLTRQRHALAIDDIATSDLLAQTRELLGQLGVGSMLLAPVLADDEPLAALVLLTSGRARPWPAGSEPLAELVTSEVATALTHARLYEREREMVQRLQELDQAKSDFVATVSHELRTPLTSICGYVEMLRDGEAGELQSGQERMLGIVQRNADRLLTLIEDLLTLSRIESGSFRVERAPVAMDGVVESTIAEFRPQASARGVELEADVAPDLPVVLGDSSQLERVLFNLLSNAIKFTLDGGRVVVRLRRSGQSVELEVQDEGIGIPEGEQDQLFSRFFRSSTSQERAIRGTGLGLVIVKSIVDHHGGEIAVKSRPGEGTTFTIRLPVAPEPASV
jgi:two-component system, OmpR family, phosphate regulon sensor histidine kinase PhoR